MQIHTLDKSTSVNELQLGNSVAHSVQSGARADFAMLLAMFSPNITETANIELNEFEDSSLNKVESIAPSYAQATSTEEAFSRGEINTKQFHGGGIQSAKLADALRPEAVIQIEDTTFSLGEEVYQNLSGHQRRQLSEPKSQGLSSHLYDHMIQNLRESQIKRTSFSTVM